MWRRSHDKGVMVQKTQKPTRKQTRSITSKSRPRSIQNKKRHFQPVFTRSFSVSPGDSLRQTFTPEKIQETRENAFDLPFAHYPATSQPASKPPLIILHGLLGRGSNWDKIASSPDLRVDRDIFTVDLRNHGSAPHSDYFDYVAMANDVRNFIIKQTPDGSATLLGHSMGGKTAAAVALIDPGRVSGLVLVDILPLNYGPKSKSGNDDVVKIVDAVAGVDFSTIETRKDIDQALKIGGVEDILVRAWLMATNVGPDHYSGNKFAWVSNAKALSANYCRLREFDIGLKENEIEPFKSSTLLILGGKSSFANRDTAAEILHKNHFPRATVEVIEGAGHWVHSDKPKQFSAAVVRWLEKEEL